MDKNIEIKAKADELWQKFGAYFEPKFSEDGKLMQKEKTRRLILDIVDEILKTSASEYEHEDNFWRNVRTAIEKL